MNPLKIWIKKSREMERHHPEMYLRFYPELVFDDKNVWMTEETLEKIRWNCGRYDGTIPTGVYCSKMFLRGPNLVWFGICKENPMTHVKWNFRTILIKPTFGSGPAKVLSRDSYR